MELQENVTRADRKASEQSKKYIVVKRFTDIVVSFTLLLLLFPLLLFISYIIYKREGGPVFYREVRVKKDNVTFMMRRFRTMTNPSRVIRALPPHPIPKSWEDGVPSKFTFQRDTYITVTQTGAWLRKYRLYKLPLLWNVLKGDMSLVGPKPEIPEIADYYNQYQMQRLKVKPGITGYAQVKENSRINHKDHRVKINDDHYYIDNFSFCLDIKIQLRTLKK